MKENIYGKLVFEIPNDTEMHENLKAIDEKAVVEAESRKIKGFYTWMMTTVATVYLENLVKLLSLKMSSTQESSIDFCDIISCTASTRKNEDAEKEGNINISFRPGDYILKISDGALNEDIIIDTLREEYSYVTKYFNFDEKQMKLSELGDDVKLLATIDKTTQKEIHEKNGFILPESFLASKITFIYVKHIYIRLLNLLKNGSRAASVNFQDLIEFHARWVRDEDDKEFIQFILRPGVNAKLFIKSDDVTEFGED